MARLVLVINCPQFGIPDLNDRTEKSTMDESIEGCISVLQGIKGGTIYNTTVQITTRGTDPGVGTNGTSSKQTSFSK